MSTGEIRLHLRPGNPPIRGGAAGRHRLRPGGVSARADTQLPASLALLAERATPELMQTVASAVDALEVAAALETCGFSNAVVQNSLGYRDVFAVAEQLYSSVGFSPTPASEVRLQRPGSVADLARGFVFAVPTLMFGSMDLVLRFWLSWWLSPLMLICGWAFSQAVACLDFSAASHTEQRGSVVLWGILAVAAVCTLLQFGGDALFGGRVLALVVSVPGCALMAAAAGLLARSEEPILAVVLLPGLVASLIFLAAPSVEPSNVVVGLALTSVVATVLAALRHVPRRWWKIPASRKDIALVTRYFAYGAFCGTFVAIFVVVQPAGVRRWPAVATYPVVLSLGAMEWQLRSVRWRSRRAALTSHTMEEYVPAARRALLRSSLCCFTVVVGATLGVQVLVREEALSVPVMLLAAVACLTGAFFLGLVAAVYGRMDAVLAVWALGLAGYGAWWVMAHPFRLALVLPPTDTVLFGVTASSLAALAVVATHAVSRFDPLHNG